MIAVNPGSLLAGKMVKEGFGVDILTRAALSEKFAEANGKYFDNNSGHFAPPHADALDPRKCELLVRAVEALLS
ncbi:MAG: hypothetical protein JXQ99_26830 [Hyphomicrobiaceae bacterium]